MSKKVVNGIEISDDTPVSEYDGKFSGAFELEVEQAAAMAYDDEVHFVVTARLDNYSFKPTKYGDLKRTNVFKVDSVSLMNDLSKAVAEIQVHQPEFPEGVQNVLDDDVDEVVVPTVFVPAQTTRHYGDMQEDVSSSVAPVTTESDGGRNYADPLLRRFLEDV